MTVPNAVGTLQKGHAICSDFESRWGSPHQVSIESLIAEERGLEREFLLKWLIRSELELRGELGEYPAEEDFLRRFPQDETIVRQAFAPVDSIGGEIEPSATESARSRNAESSPRKHGGPPGSFGSYEVLGEIARGGMGVVYRARHRTLNRVVALKVILSGQLASDHEMSRFLQETRAIAALDHPGIVPIYEVGEDTGYHFFSMPLVDGGNLGDAVTSGPLKPRVAAELVSTVARAVHFAHGHGIIHRDLKPRNILLDRNGAPKVTDFGLAKFAVPETSPFNGDSPPSGATLS
ncbi:MAG TPA: serine/threonine-protein kinase, partial [Pirellulaceae bacterium]